MGMWFWNGTLDSMDEPRWFRYLNHDPYSLGSRMEDESRRGQNKLSEGADVDAFKIPGKIKSPSGHEA